jgi:hypothetical protein
MSSLILSEYRRGFDRSVVPASAPTASYFQQRGQCHTISVFVICRAFGHKTSFWQNRDLICEHLFYIVDSFGPNTTTLLGTPRGFVQDL